MEEALEQTTQTTSRPSYLGVLKVPLASELTIKRKFACNPALVGQNVHVHSGHTHASFAFYQLSLRIIGNFLLNNRVDK